MGARRNIPLSSELEQCPVVDRIDHGWILVTFKLNQVAMPFFQTYIAI